MCIAFDIDEVIELSGDIDHEVAIEEDAMKMDLLAPRLIGSLSRSTALQLR